MNQLTGFWYGEATAVLLLAWIAALVFPIVYAMTMRFWESELGMHFFSYGVAVWLNLTPSAIFLLFGDFPGRGVIVLVNFHLMAGVILWRAMVFLKIFRNTHNGEGDNFTPHHTHEKEELQ
jgi:hypothetical protein